MSQLVTKIECNASSGRFLDNQFQIWPVVGRLRFVARYCNMAIIANMKVKIQNTRVPRGNIRNNCFLYYPLRVQYTGWAVGPASLTTDLPS